MSNNDRNLSTMHRAGADVVLSYASTGATELWNLLRDETTLLVAEGLLVFGTAVPDGLAGRRLRDTDIARRTGCTVIAVSRDGTTETDIGPDTRIPEDGRLILVGTDAAEERFLSRYVADASRPTWDRITRRLASR